MDYNLQPEVVAGVLVRVVLTTEGEDDAPTNLKPIGEATVVPSVLFVGVNLKDAEKHIQQKDEVNLLHTSIAIQRKIFLIRWLTS